MNSVINPTFLLIIQLMNTCCEEISTSTCDNVMPFKAKINSYENFTNFCVKKDDPDCKRFSERCPQCPATNYSALIKMHILLFVCIAIIPLLLVVLILVIIFKLINSNENKKTQSLNIDMDRKITQILQNLKDLNLPTQKAKFYKEGYDDPIEMEIGKTNTIIQVKKQICFKLQNNNPNIYKIMKLSINGTFLDDNRYFSSLDLIEEDKIICEFDNNADPNDNVIIQLKGNVKLPKLIRIEKYRTISYLRTVISRIENINENHKIFIFDKINKSQLKEVKEDQTIEDLQLEDDDVMQIILQKDESLIINSIFNDDFPIKIEYSNVDLVAHLKKSIADKLKSDQNEFFLFLNDRIMSNDRFAFEYLIENHPSVKYCKFMKLNDIEIKDKSLMKGTFGELFNAKIKETNVDIMIKRYDVMITTEVEDNFHIIRELKSFQLTKSHPRFVQVIDLYKDEYYVFVAMEHMSNGTLSLYLRNHPTKVEDNIAQWSRQILEGLKFLHMKEIIHRDLNPKSILLDSSLEIKLSNFNLSKYSDFHHLQTFNKSIKQKSRVPLRYVAPETIINEVCNPQTDIWSFGAIFLRMVSKKKPYWWIMKSKITNHIFEIGCKDYKCTNDVKIDEKKIIEMCMKGNSNERPTAGELLEMSFFQQTRVTEK